jgi:hypothetical protein
MILQAKSMFWYLPLRVIIFWTMYDSTRPVMPPETIQEKWNAVDANG